VRGSCPECGWDDEVLSECNNCGHSWWPEDLPSEEELYLLCKDVKFNFDDGTARDHRDVILEIVERCHGALTGIKQK
jgi:hypothetical protein